MLPYCVTEAVVVVVVVVPPTAPVNDDDLIRFEAVNWFDVNFSCDIRFVAKGLHVWGSKKEKKN